MSESISEGNLYHAVERGREAWRRLKTDSTWDDWVVVGTALDIGRTECMRRAGSNHPIGRAYNEAFSAWLARNEFADIDKGTRSRLLDCIEHRAEVESWRASLKLDERLRLNHPNSVWRRWQSARKLRDARPARRNLIPPLEAAVENAVGRLENASPGIFFDLSPEHIGESIDNMIEIFGEPAVKDLHKRLTERFLAPLARRGRSA